MKKVKYYVIVAALLMNARAISIGQTPVPVQVVIDPQSIQQLKDMQATMEKLNSSLDFVQGFLEKTESFKQLKKVLEKMACGTQKMEILIAVDENLSFCDKSLDIDVTLLHLEHISTKLMIFGQAIAMSKNESIQSMDDMIDLVTEAIQRVEATNTRLIINQHKLNELAGIEFGVQNSNMSDLNGNI